MAAESNIDPADGWFAGEDKTLRYAVAGDTEGIGTWDLEWTLYPVGGAPYVLGPSAMTVTPGVPALVDVAVPSDATVALSTDEVHQAVLRRVDPGSRRVLSFGAVSLRSEVLE